MEEDPRIVEDQIAGEDQTIGEDQKTETAALELRILGLVPAPPEPLVLRPNLELWCT